MAAAARCDWASEWRRALYSKGSEPKKNAYITQTRSRIVFLLVEQETPPFISPEFWCVQL